MNVMEETIYTDTVDQGQEVSSLDDVVNSLEQIEGIHVGDENILDYWYNE